MLKDKTYSKEQRGRICLELKQAFTERKQILPVEIDS